MRSFEQRKEEIFRRSEARIRERKRKRRGALAACGALALCVGMIGWSASWSASPENGDRMCSEEALIDALPEQAVEPDHIHALAQPQESCRPEAGYCGNTQTTLYIGGGSYTFMLEPSVEMTDLLRYLPYNEDKRCDCPAEYRADTEFGTGYEINLTRGFVRCREGQADLTAEQLETLTRIIAWAKQKM